MDSLTHIAIGACMGEGFVGKTVGRKAMLWGALAQSIPDIDFIAALWMDTPRSLLAHRGFTHSFLFGAFMAVFMALLAERWHRPHNISLKRWLRFFTGVIFVHLFLDAFNNYGVGWFEPFSSYRISFNAIYVADPFFSIGPGIACLALFLLKKLHLKRRFWWRFGLVTSGIYLMYCTFNKVLINREVLSILKRQDIPHEQYFTTPAPLQNWLWYVVSGDEKGFYVGYRSLFDRQENMDFHFFPRQENLLTQVQDPESLHRLKRFSQGYYTAERWSDTLVFNDLRFGQVIGWQDPNEKFAFHFYLDGTWDNRMVVQRGRFAKWDEQVVKTLWKKIKGN
ncbi:MAG TPA: metal-dependent hydrolase [Saprospiraceae bacterium]|nr:metal-dependent hydrolase [Saprospiraceae bacterium]HPI07810.1 metal-dependent hydrolase [Saprospiraceae bacterium]